MIRLYVNHLLQSEATLCLDGAQAHYLVSVMRVPQGSHVLLFDNRSGEWEAEVTDVARRSVGLRVTRRMRPRESPPDLWLCAAPLKKGRIDWVAEKACELGLARLVPVITRRTVVDSPNLGRLAAHMIEAAEQCGRTALPELADPITLTKLLAEWPEGRTLLFCDEEGGDPMPPAPAPAAILIGPEGGFDAAERAAIRAHPQARAIGLGPRILRADTAAVAAISVWMAQSGDWRGPVA
jgi:16S rRNA (uracil1498-N3)-methyltransferase